MKISRTKSLAGLALTCLALAGSSSFAAGTSYVLSTFDSDLGSNPWATNMWVTTDTDTPYPAAYAWTNYGNPAPIGLPAGSMVIDLDWTATTGQWDWQDCKLPVYPWSSNAPAGPGDTNYVDFSKFDQIEFDTLVVTNGNVSQTNDAGQYCGLYMIAQFWAGWGSNPTNLNNGYNTLGNVTLTNGGYWQHASFSVSAWPYTLGKLIIGPHMQQNTIAAVHNKVLIDNIKFTSAGVPPVMQYAKAVRGLNMWQTGGQYDRNSFETSQDGSQYYCWAGGNGGGTYSMTIGSFPTASGKSNYVARLYVVGGAGVNGEASPDWSEPDVVMMEIGVDTNNFATATFHWKTNAANSNGAFYDTASQITLTNPTPVGKWTLAFDSSETGVTMTAPTPSNYTNFVMGVHANVPDIHGNFGNKGTARFGTYGSGANGEAKDLQIVFTEAVVKGPSINTVSNNWLVETTMPDTNSLNRWMAVGTVYSQLVPINNANWVNWTVPDGGFTLNTNGVQPGLASAWSVATNLPAASAFPNHKGVLVKPGDLPASKNMFFVLIAPKTP